MKSPDYDSYDCNRACSDCRCLILIVGSLRRDALANLVLALGLGTVATLFIACSPSEFERQYKQAVLENPPGVELRIRTRDGRKQYAPSESVDFEEFYTSKYRNHWHIEISEGRNDASSSTVVHISNGKAMESQGSHTGIICCDSRHVWLTIDAVRVPYKLFTTPTRDNLEGWRNPDWHVLHLPNERGRYQVYITSYRLFSAGENTKTYGGKGAALTSNIITLEVK